MEIRDRWLFPESKGFGGDAVPARWYGKRSFIWIERKTGFFRFVAPLPCAQALDPARVFVFQARCAPTPNMPLRLVVIKHAAYLRGHLRIDARQPFGHILVYGGNIQEPLRIRASRALCPPGK